MTNDTQITEGVDRAVRAGLMAGGYQHRAIRDALLAEFVVIPRSELPEAGGIADGYIQVGDIDFTRGGSIESRRDYAYKALALVHYLEAEEAERATVEAQRNARRDELADQFSGCGQSYRTVSRIAKKAIDRVIELEEAAA